MISREASEILLKSGTTGLFLIRESETARGQLTLSLKDENCVWHYRIKRGKDATFFVTDSSRFSTLAEFVNHHSKNSDGFVTQLICPATMENRDNIFPTKP